MNYKKALEIMDKGKKVRRGNYFCVYLYKNKNELLKCEYDDEDRRYHGIVTHFCPTEEDKQTTDWRELDDNWEVVKDGL